MPELLVDLTASVATNATLLIVVMSLAACIESALGIGAIFPGEATVAIGAVLLPDPRLLAVALPAVAVGALLGDHVGYALGTRLGPAIADSRLVGPSRRGVWNRASAMVTRQGVLPLVLARQLPGVRTVVSAACGASALPYRRFLLGNALGALLWATCWTLGPRLLGEAWRQSASLVVALALLALLALVALAMRGRVRAA